MLEVSERSEPPEPLRRRTVPIKSWWTQAVDRQLKLLGLSQKRLAEMIGAQQPEVSRAISRAKPVLELVIAITISDALAIPYPVIIPDSETEALALAMQRRLIRRDMQLSEITSGVDDLTDDDQTDGIPFENASKAGRSRRGGGSQRRVRPG